MAVRIHFQTGMNVLTIHPERNEPFAFIQVTVSTDSVRLTVICHDDECRILEFRAFVSRRVSRSPNRMGNVKKGETCTII